MPEPIISVRNLTKSYRLYEKPSDRLKEAVWPWKKRYSLFHALHDVSFDVHRGEHIGVIGVNGAGKSTLLQVLTGVLAPTSGTVSVKGRVMALLELGAGFNAELSGRENVSFQLQLADFDSKSAERKMEEIEAFADIGEFFDQPMKLYSSGMYARVAFAASALAEPEILIVDEALSVGDTRFQKKCMDRMRRMKEAGVTILLVSHNIFGARADSSRMLMLHRGTVKAEGDPEYVAAEYMKMLFPAANPGNPPQAAQATPATPTAENAPASGPANNDYVYVPDITKCRNMWGKGGATIKEVRAYGLQSPNRFVHGQKLAFEFDYQFDTEWMLENALKDDVPLHLCASLRVDTAKGLILCDFSSRRVSRTWPVEQFRKEKTYTFRIEGTLPKLLQGEYFFTPAISIGEETRQFPVAAFENMFSLHCEGPEVVLGLFRPAYTVELKG